MPLYFIETRIRTAVPAVSVGTVNVPLFGVFVEAAFDQTSSPASLKS